MLSEKVIFIYPAGVIGSKSPVSYPFDNLLLPSLPYMPPDLIYAEVRSFPVGLT